MTDQTPFGLLRQHEMTQSEVDQLRQPADHMLDDLHQAYLAGHASGYAAGQMAASVDLARSWLIDLAHDAERMAGDEATRRHGQGWADEIHRQSRPAPHHRAVGGLRAVAGL